MTDKDIAQEAANLAARTPGATLYNAAEFALSIASERAACATAEQSEPYGVVYEWDCGPGVVHRDFGFCTYNGQYPDRTVTVYAAPVEANTLKVKK